MGTDALSDKRLKAILLRNRIIADKVKDHFEHWFNGTLDFPKYLKTARTMFLSKDDTEYPEIGNVRIISMLSAVVKLWEQVLHTKLRKEIEEKMPLHVHQRGFVPGGSCLKNIDDLFDLIEKIKKVPGEALKYPKIPHTAKKR